MGLHVSIEWIKAALASGTPKQTVQRELCRCRRAVSGTSSPGWQIAEKGSIWIENEDPFIVVPHWIKLSEIGHIERALLQARVVEDDRLLVLRKKPSH
jgi:hypothetical protein